MMILMFLSVCNGVTKNEFKEVVVGNHIYIFNDI